MNISCENELLLCIARSQMDAQAEVRFHQLLKEELDWSSILIKAERHRLGPLLYQHLKESSEKIPETVFENLKRFFGENTKNNLLLMAETIRLVHLFEENGIVAIPYKGATLAEQLYSNLTLRSCVDLDLLVCRKDLKRARQILLNADYRQEIEISDEQLNLYSRSECDQVFIHRQTQIYLELHWSITPPYFGFNLEIEDLISHLERIEFNGNRIPSLRAEDLLLILCVNATKEMWERLEWIGGVAELIRKKQDLNWNETIERAKSLNSLRMFLLGVHLANELFRVALPPNVSSLIKQDRAIKALIQQVYERIFTGGEENLSITTLTLFRLKAREKLSTRFRYCLQRLITPTHSDLKFIKLPRFLFSLYYVVRPLRLLVRPIFVKFQSKFSQKHECMTHEAAE